MKIKYINNLIFLIPMILLIGCYGVNKKRSHIGDVELYDTSKDIWEIALENNSIELCRDSTLLDGLPKFKEMPFSCDFLIFCEEPREIVAVSKNHYFVRYVFNPVLSNKVLDGLSKELNESDKQRILDRVTETLKLAGR